MHTFVASVLMGLLTNIYSFRVPLMKTPISIPNLILLATTMLKVEQLDLFDVSELTVRTITMIIQEVLQTFAITKCRKQLFPISSRKSVGYQLIFCLVPQNTVFVNHYFRPRFRFLR